MYGLEEKSTEERIDRLERIVQRLSELIVWLIRSVDVSSDALDELDKIAEEWEQENEKNNIGNTE